MKFKLDSVVLLLVTLLTGTRATEYFVSLDGNDDNPGTLQKPWQHVQHAVTVLRAGDICTIREGHYFEEVVISGLQGTSDDPITFRSYQERMLFSMVQLPSQVHGKSTRTISMSQLFRMTFGSCLLMEKCR